MVAHPKTFGLIELKIRPIAWVCNKSQMGYALLHSHLLFIAFCFLIGKIQSPQLHFSGPHWRDIPLPIVAAARWVCVGVRGAVGVWC